MLIALVFSPPAEAWRLAAWMLAIVLVSGGVGTALVMTRVQRLVDRLAEQEDKELAKRLAPHLLVDVDDSPVYARVVAAGDVEGGDA